MEHEKEHHHGEAAKGINKDETSSTGASTPRRTLRKVETKFQTRRTVITIVPTKASNAALLSVMEGV
jgi:hypothetical protein